MNATRIPRTTVGYLWRIPLCATAYVAGTVAGGALVSALGMPLPEVPEQASEQMLGLFLFIACVALALGLAPLARRLQGAYWMRWLMLAAPCYACLGAALPLEGAIYTTLGGMGSIPLLSILPCLLFAAVLALLFKPAERADSFLANAGRFFQGRSAGGWAWRFAAAVCAFPVIYWTFGLMVAPFVLEYYRQGQFALSVPNPGVIVLVQFLRSVLFLAAAVPILIMWSGSRRHLVLALGLAFYVLVGLFGMIQSYWLAPTLQVLHNLEMFVDSMVHALALVLLLTPPNMTRADELYTCLLPCLGRAQTPVGN